jgi:hypothetical protein
MLSLSRFVACLGLGAACLVGGATAGSSVAQPQSAYRVGASAHFAATPHLTYYGGRVLSHVKVDVVVWGSWSYDTSVPLTGKRSIASFAGGITNSRYIDWLREYNTPTQQIARGTFDGVYTVHPAGFDNGPVVTDAQIKSTLTLLINTGKLPKPTTDRVYIVFFRKGQRISRPEGDSQTAFCAYHDTMSYPLHSVYYAAIPYELNNRGCRPTAFPLDIVTTITSHELVESITDPGIGLHRLSWYDKANGEIGDICAHTSTAGSVVGGDGVHYVVQREWSNRLRSCTLVG